VYNSIEPLPELTAKSAGDICLNLDKTLCVILFSPDKPDADGKIVLGERGKLKGKPQPDASLRDTENVPLAEDVQAYFKREVLPHAPDAWIAMDATKIGYEISFTRHFYKPQPLRTLAEISADILAIEKEAEGLLDGLLVTGGAA